MVAELGVEEEGWGSSDLRWRQRQTDLKKRMGMTADVGMDAVAVDLLRSRTRHTWWWGSGEI